MSRRRDRELEARLRELSAPDEAEAQARAWPVIREAYTSRTPIRPAPRVRRLALIAVGGVAALAIGLSPAGAKVGDLVRDVAGVDEEDAKPALRSLPAPGELLVESEQGPWVVHEDGSKRLLGDYGQATWSPTGRYVAVSDRRELIALEPDGTVRWTYPAPGIVRDPRWTGDTVDTRIAYRSGDDLRVIAGDGNPQSDHLIAPHVAPLAAAWRQNGFVLTYVERDGHVQSVNADTGTPLNATPDDRRRLSGAASGSAEDRALSPDGSRVARLEHVGASDRLIVTRPGGSSVLFFARSHLTGPVWSPDGRWILIGWPAADQWLFIDTDKPRDVVPVGRISEQFDPGGDGEGRFPRPAGWILPER